MTAPNVISRDGSDISGPTANAPTNQVPGIFFYDTTLDIPKVVNAAGVCVPVAASLGGPGAITAAAGSSSTTAGVLPAATAAVYPVSASDGTKGVIINAADNITGRLIRLINLVAGQPIIVYPPSGGTIDNGSANASYSGTSGKGIQLYCETPGTWFVV
jgi:hypothetical protein